MLYCPECGLTLINVTSPAWTSKKICKCGTIVTIFHADAMGGNHQDVVKITHISDSATSDR